MSKYGLYSSGISGIDDNSDNSVIVYKYDNNKFNNINNNSKILNDEIIYDIIAYHDELYLSGAEVNNNNKYEGHRVIKYNDTNKTFEDVPFSDSLKKGSGNIIYSMAVYDGDLYLGGIGLISDGDGDDAYDNGGRYIARYNKITNKFDTLSDGLKLNSSITITCMAVYNDNLYLCGFATDDTTAYFVRYNKSSNKFTSLNTITGLKNVFIVSMAVYDGNLYLGGIYSGGYGDDLNFIAKFNDSDTTKVEIVKNKDDLKLNPNYKQTTNYDNAITCMTVYDGDLYIGGHYGDNNKNYTKYVAKYNNKNNILEPITEGIEEKIKNGFTGVNTMTVYDGKLYIGGGGESLYEASDDNDNDDKEFIFVYDKPNNKFNRINGLNTKGGSAIMTLYHWDSKKDDNLPLILGLSLGLGIPVLVAIIYIISKYGIKPNLTSNSTSN